MVETAMVALSLAKVDSVLEKVAVLVVETVMVALSLVKVDSVQTPVVAILAVADLHLAKVVLSLETVAAAALRVMVDSDPVMIRARRVKAAALDVALAAAAPRVKVALDPVRIRVQPVMTRVARAVQVVLVANAATTAFLSAAKIRLSVFLIPSRVSRWDF